MSTCGSSPSTYGMVFFAATAYPNHRVADSAGIPAWVWQWFIWLLPVTLSSRYGILDVMANVPSLLHRLCTKTTKEHSKGLEKKKPTAAPDKTNNGDDTDGRKHTPVVSTRKKPIKRPFLMLALLVVGVLPLLQAKFSRSGMTNTEWFSRACFQKLQHIRIR
mmetsp:Transcript_2630/g.3640  ORF Transcript_2630/g.3640 Transcript_2630/m.3640 type:complete len:162 (+) Transcript_2630:99-584(+)